SAAWWERCPLSNAGGLPNAPAVYCIYDPAGTKQLSVYVGETLSLGGRAKGHAAARWPIREPWIAYRLLPSGTSRQVLHQLQSDILGWHFWLTGEAPLCQYRAEKNRSAS